MTEKEVFEMSKAANDCIIDIVESYMEFVDIMQKTLDKCKVPPKINILARSLIAQRRLDWMPVLDRCKKHRGDMENEKHE